MSTTIAVDEHRTADHGVIAPPATGPEAPPARAQVPIMLAVVPAMGEE